MNIFHAAVLGLIEGLTEFLPVSSTFHLLFAERLLGLGQTEFAKFFAVFIQAAAMIPVVLLYAPEWLKDREFLKKTVVAFVPTAIAGLVLHKVIKGVFFESTGMMLASFVGVGVVFLLVEFLVQKGKLKSLRSLAELSYPQAFLIGAVQALAVMPGVSRAGAVIVGMMLLGFKRDEAAKFSFSLAVPTIVAAAAFDLLKTDFGAVLVGDAVVLLLVGSIAAAASAFLVVRWLLSFLRRNSLAPFAWYRFGLAAALLVLLGK